MPQKSRRKKQQLSHLKAAPQARAPEAAASFTGTSAAAVAQPRLTAPKSGKQPAQLNWPLHVGAELRTIAIIAGAILVVLVIVSLALS